MSIARKLLMGAAGAGSKSTYVDDVFSTYLYKGNGIIKPVSNGIKLANNNLGSSVSMIGDGSGSGYGTGCIYVPPTADFKFGTGAFTIEFFIYFVQSTDYIAVFDGRTNNSNNNNDRTVTGLLASGQFNWWNLGANQAVIANSAATQVAANEWSHVAYVREGTGTNQAKMYINGSLVGTGTDDMDYSVDQPARIGGHAWSPGILYGSFSNYRVVKGTAVYTSNFTPPTQELTAISGTVLLCCQSSTDPFAATVSPGGTFTNGNNNSVNPIAESFGPFTASDGEGGLVWIKRRNSSGDHQLYDTDRGTNKGLSSESNAVQWDYGNGLTAFNNNGFLLGSLGGANANNDDQASWTFRKQKGFCDIVTYTGNNTARTISHNLGCVPGFIMVKATNRTSDWICWHTGLGDTDGLALNSTSAKSTPPWNATYWNNTNPTATHFSIGTNADVNHGDSGTEGTYVAYVFAGGRSPIDYSTDFDGTGDYLSIPASNDLELDGDFTIECWVYCEYSGNSERQTIIGNDKTWTTNQSCLQICNPSSGAYYNTVTLWDYDSDASSPIAHSVGLTGNTGWVMRQSWHHIAVVRKSNNIRIYIDGRLSNYTTQNNSNTLHFGTGETWIGKVNISNECYNGKISNLRVVKGQAIYETNFIVPKSPLTTTSQGATASNVKLLCCNTSTTTGSTVTPGTITANGDAAVNSDNPFKDAKSKIFGEEGDQNIIACGKYTGKSEGADGPWVDLGWQPQWVLIKRTNGVTAWQLFDNMRGIVTGGNDMILNPDSNAAEITSQNRLRLEPFGFRLDENDGDTSTDGGEYVYMAIRSEDGLVSAPVEVGNRVFDTDTGAGAGVNPTFEANFDIDMGIMRQPATIQDWFTSTRISGDNFIYTNGPNNQSAGGGSLFEYDYSKGWCNSSAVGSSGNLYQSWMWKRGAGFDTVTYRGNETAGRAIQHSLGRVPEMIWLKSRSDSYDWAVYSKFLNNGVTPEQWAVKLNYDTQEQQKDWFNNQAPTATEFYIDNSATANKTTSEFISMLFASVKGISQCGTYDGSASEITITFDDGGFSPRYVLIKRISGGSGDWVTMDTRRGWGTTGPVNDCVLYLNKNNAEYCSTYDWGAPTATGMRLGGGSGYTNDAGSKYIYYAHA